MNKQKIWHIYLCKSTNFTSDNKEMQIVFVHEKGIANTRVNFSTGEHLQYWITIFSAKDASKQKPDSIP